MEHEYALLGGFNRALIGRWVGTIAAAISGLLVFLLLAAVDLAAKLGISATLPPMVLSWVGAGVVYGGLYFTFNHVIWRIGPLANILRVPNLAGKWSCEGLRLEVSPAQPWAGQVTIVQTWDRIRLHLETNTSASNSIAAALQYDAAVGYRLLYHYRNQPKAGSKRLQPHHGFAELVVSHDGKSANGEYFNGRGRNSFGTMNLRKETA